MSLAHSMLCQQFVDCCISCDKGQTVEQFKSLMGEAALLTDASNAQGCFMDYLQSEPGFDA